MDELARKVTHKKLLPEKCTHNSYKPYKIFVMTDSSSLSSAQQTPINTIIPVIYLNRQYTHPLVHAVDERL